MRGQTITKLALGTCAVMFRRSDTPELKIKSVNKLLQHVIKPVLELY